MGESLCVNALPWSFSEHEAGKSIRQGEIVHCPKEDIRCQEDLSRAEILGIRPLWIFLFLVVLSFVNLL